MTEYTYGTQKVEQNRHNQQTIQSHNAVNIPANTNSSGLWVDMNGFDKVAVNAKADTAATYAVNMDWSVDGITQTGSTSVVGAANGFTKAGQTDILARYGRITLVSTDAAAHVFNAWMMLKA